MPGTLIVSLDFELFWGVCSSKRLDNYKENILGVEEAIPRLLNLFQKHGIHATWATVGFVFADCIQNAEIFFPDNSLKPTYSNTKVSTYNYATRNDLDQDKALFFAPELIKLIAKANGQEIGSHTFSHYFCKEPGQTIEQFDADIQSAIQIAGSKGYKICSIVLPRNQCDTQYTSRLSAKGFTAFRDEENDWIHKINIMTLRRALRLMDVYFPLTGQGGYIPKKENGIWNFTGSRMYKPFFQPLAVLEPLKVMRIKHQMLHAAKNGLVFHLWWHPHNIGVRTDFHLKQLKEIFSYYNVLQKKYGMQSKNMHEMVQELESDNAFLEIK